MFNKFASKLMIINPIEYNIILMVLLFALSIPTFGLTSDEKAPIQITANEATVDQKSMISVFNGNLVITRGSLIVHADKGVASQDKHGAKTLILTGTPVTFVQTQDDGGVIEGQANKFEYNSQSNLAVLTGRARVRKGKNEVIGDTLTYNTQTQVYSAQSNFGDGVKKSSSGRITVILDQDISNGATRTNNR
ncbi:MAG: lipopolysaccharide transport periplasmic protein LptA [Burkholderiales bacterium]|nr:lipopolysaccharide transport periplasmic protein LptA [Burkholderiales bacterium]